MISFAGLKRSALLVALAGIAACGSTEPKPAPATISARSSTVAAGTVGQPASASPSVRVLDAAGVGVEDVQVTFAVTGGGGSLSAATATTDAEGVATAATWTLGTVAGPNTVTASVAGVAGSPVTFTVNAAADAPATITINAGNNQTAIAGSAVAVAPSVKVVDQFGNAVTGRSVSFLVTGGGGSVTQATATTNASGIATVGSWSLGPAPGANTLSAAPTQLATLSVSFSATGIDGPTAVAAFSGNLQAATAGAAVGTLPSVRVTNAQGVAVPGVTVNFAVGLGGGSITGATTTTNASGVATVGSWTLGAAGALNTLVATVPAITGGTNSVTISASGCVGGGAGYKLTVCLTSEMTTTQRAAFLDAAARWATVITGELPDITFANGVAAGACLDGTFALPSGAVVDDLLIFAQVVPIDGPSGVLGQAGWCSTRNVGGQSVLGAMQFDVADMNNLEAAGRLNAVILHEMGHVIGIGSLWNHPFGHWTLAHNLSTSTVANDTFFNGANGIAGFDAIGGAGYAGNKVPVENTGGPGTRNAHWRESVLANELMTGFISGTSQPLSLVTVRSLQDMGYTVNVASADAFSITTALTDPSRSANHPVFDLRNDILTGPAYAVDHLGRIVRRLR